MVERRIILGLDIRADAINRGLSLGYGDSRIAFDSAHRSAVDSPCESHPGPVALRWHNADGCWTVGVFLHPLPFADASYFSHRIAVGIDLRGGRYAQGISLGALSSSITVPVDDGRFHVLHYRSRNPVAASWTTSFPNPQKTNTKGEPDK